VYILRSSEGTSGPSQTLGSPHRSNANCLDARLALVSIWADAVLRVLVYKVATAFCFTKCTLIVFLSIIRSHCLESNAKMSNIRLRHIFLAFADLLTTLPKPVHSQAACLSLRPPVHQVVYEQAVSINTDVLYNTTFYPLPEAAITVTNAPTSYSGVTTLQWTSTILEDDTGPSNLVTHSTAPLASPTQAQDTFVLVAMRARQVEKRQSGSYFVSSEGTITNDCTTAPIYTARNGVLTASVGGVVYTYSTSTGVSFAPFVPSTLPGSITTSFTIGANAVLQWHNDAFHNGQADFCAVQNGTIYAVFAQDAQPSGCFFISLSLFDVSSCQAISLATITGPPGPIGSTGAQGVPGIQGPIGATVWEISRKRLHNIGI